MAFLYVCVGGRCKKKYWRKGKQTKNPTTGEMGNIEREREKSNSGLSDTQRDARNTPQGCAAMAPVRIFRSKISRDLLPPLSSFAVTVVLT